MIEKLKQYYSKAIRTSLVAQDRLTKHWYHIFSVIELQTEDEYPYSIPNEKWHDGCVRAGQSGLESYSYYLSIDEIYSIEKAIEIFSSPIKNFFIDGKSISFVNTSFVKEPSGDYPLTFASNVYAENGISSILPKRKSGLFVWCQIDNQRMTENLFISQSLSKEMLAIQHLTTEWLGFDIIQKREHIGNIYLSAPNPFFREIEISLSSNPIGFFYKILTRKTGFKPLKFRVIDLHGDSIALDKIFEIKNNSGLIELPHEPHLFELRVYNEDDDLIATREPAGFLRSIQFGLSVKQADFHVTLKGEDDEKEFTIEKFSKESPSVIGTPKSFNPEHYFKTADEKRKHLKLAENKEFIFYPGAKSESEKGNLKENAKSVIRTILNNARDTCYLCDPYFGSLDIIEFAFHIKNSGVKINILNSKEKVPFEEARKITDVIKEYNSKPFSDIEVRVLKGKSILHDRFIIADKNIWFIGSSFNEIGARATCIAKVPESTGHLIIKEIEKWYTSEDYSQDISEYAKQIENG